MAIFYHRVVLTKLPAALDGISLKSISKNDKVSWFLRLAVSLLPYGEAITPEDCHICRLANDDNCNRGQDTREIGHC